jgi:hypothetical protein
VDARNTDLDLQHEQILDRLEFEGRSAAKLAAIRLHAVERWRWDEPSVSFHWANAGGMWRGVTMRVDILENSLDIEGNAWLDHDLAGTLRRRRWHHESLAHATATGPIPSLAEAFRVVQSWRHDKLEAVDETGASNG